MAFISPDSGYLTVLNIFRADEPDKQGRLLGAMRRIVDAAAYEGWVSSTVHSGVDRIGTANFIQWQRQENLEQRYASDEFKHQIPMFAELTTWIRLLQTEVAYTQLGSAPGVPVEISPERDDYTAIEIFGVAPENLDRLVTALGKEREWLPDIAGYRSHSLLRGKGIRGKWAKPIEGSFVVSYSQWDSKEAFDAFLTLPEREQSARRRRVQAELDEIVTSVERNTYQVLHSRSAGGATVSRRQVASTARDEPPAPAGEQPGQFALLGMIMGSMVTQAIHVAAQLGIADLLAGGPRTASDIAASAGSDPEATERLLSTLASFSIFSKEDDRFGLTPVGDGLRADAPFSVRDMALLVGHPFQWEDWGHLIDAVRTGKAVLPTFRGMGGYEFLEANPEFAKTFEGGMGGLSQMENEPIAEAYDFSPFRTIVDVFGGQGALLTAILRGATNARGVLCDARAEQLGAAAAFEKAGLADRCEVELGGFFDQPPSGGDAYLLKHIVHEWPEPQALEILRNVRKAINDDGRLLLMEFVLPEGPDPHPGRLVDLWLMVLMGGRERTAAQYADLLARTGFRLERVVPTAADVAIVEATPV